MNLLKMFLSAGLSCLMAFGAGMPVFASDIFDDVGENSPYYTGIKYCKEHGIMTGTTATTFNDLRALTRGEMITVLWRMEGEPEAGQDGFDDVSSDSFYKKASNWAKQTGIMTGNSHPDLCWTFDGNDPLTKEQACLIFCRYSQNFKGGAFDGSSSLPVWLSQASPWAAEAVRWAESNNYVHHMDGEKYYPSSYYPLKEEALRGWVATFIQRYLESNTNPGSSNPGNTAPSNPVNPLDEEVKALLTSWGSWGKDDALDPGFAASMPLLIVEFNFNPDGRFNCRFFGGGYGSGTYTISNSQVVEDNSNVKRYKSVMILNDFSTPQGMFNGVRIDLATYDGKVSKYDSLRIYLEDYELYKTFAIPGSFNWFVTAAS